MRRSAPLVLLVLLALAGAVAATVVARLDLVGLVSGSEHIVAGRVLSVEVVRDRRGGLGTRVTLALDAVWKGPALASLSFLLPGGEQPGEGLRIAGMPRFVPGQDVLLFLTEQSERGLRVPVGLGQGSWRIERDPDTGGRSLRRSLAGMSLRDPASGQLLPGVDEERLDYEPFVAALRRAVEAERSTPPADGR